MIFDLETQLSSDDVGGWQNIRDMKLAFASVYRFPAPKNVPSDSSLTALNQGEWLDFWEKDVERLALTLVAADLVVGFNLRRFDYEVLRGYGRFDDAKVPTYDILAEIIRVLGHRLSLGAVAGATLGAKKSADGLQSLDWWKRGEIAKVATYCRQDVEVTRDLFFHILEKGYLLFEKKGIGLVRIPLRYKDEG